MDNTVNPAAVSTLPAPVEPQYDPYTYLPMQRAFFMTSNFSPLPDKDNAVAQQYPVLATHINSVWSFLDWMQKTSPELYSVITNQRPDLTDASGVVLNGKLSVDSLPVAATPATASSGLSGLADADLAPFDWSDLTADDITTWGNATAASPTVTPTTTPTADTSPLTQWGTSILDTIQSTLPAYFQAKSQSDLMKINIARAEQGLPPIDSSSLAPTVNVGVSPAVQQFMYIAVGGLVLVGLYGAFRSESGDKKRK